MDKHDQEVLETGKAGMKIPWLSHKCKSLEQSHPTESLGSQDSLGSGCDSTAITAHHTPTISTKASRKISQLWCCSSQSSACSGITGTHTAVPADPTDKIQRTRWPLFLSPPVFQTHWSPLSSWDTFKCCWQWPNPARAEQAQVNSAGRTKNVYNAQYSGLACTSAPGSLYLTLLLWGMSSTC